MPEMDSQDAKELLLTADLNNPLWYEEPVADSREYPCIHEISSLATPSPLPQPIPVTQALQPNQGVPAISPQQADQVEVPPEFELMELDITEDLPDLLDLPEDVMSNFDTCAQDVPSY